EPREAAVERRDVTRERPARELIDDEEDDELPARRLGRVRRRRGRGGTAGREEREGSEPEGLHVEHLVADHAPQATINARLRRGSFPRCSALAQGGRN